MATDCELRDFLVEKMPERQSYYLFSDGIGVNQNGIATSSVIDNLRDGWYFWVVDS
jgi:hypothetical protein